MKIFLEKIWMKMIVICLLAISVNTYAQSISLNHPVKCGKLQCFPSSTLETEYYYLPANPHVALNDHNKHEFSFTRYIESASESTAGGFTEADGGGIIHFLVDYTVPESDLRVAREALKEIHKDAVLRGPILFESGNFALVSSVAQDPEKPNGLSRQVIGVGPAPLIEGLKAAVSIHLTKKGAQILWNSFQMDTPDISLVFEMTFSGLNDPVDATIKADWSKLHSQADSTFGAKVGYMGIGAEFNYEDFWQDAKDSGAITIEYKGDPAQLQSIIDRAYSRLHDLMFEPIPAATSQGNDSNSLSDLLNASTAVAGQFGNNTTYSAPWEVKISGGYKRRNIKQTGSYTFDFRQRTKVSLTTAMAGNIGNLYKLYGDDPGMFRTINLSDPEYRIREISVALDARDESEFDKYINHVTLSLQKKHGSGDSTAGELTFNRKSFQSGQLQRLNYSWRKEPDLTDWMKYQYKVNWSFVGGAKFSSDWIETNSPAIALTPPYQYKEIEFVASEDTLQSANVRMVSIRVKHDFFGREVSETINLLPDRGEFSAKRIFAVPPDKDSINYVLTWTLKNKKKLTSGNLTSDETVIFCDEIPEPK
jgi:hypothetical protein